MTFRCPECRTRRKDYKLFTRHLQSSGHVVCGCGGYWFPHRKGSPCCESNEYGMWHVARRAGATDDELCDIRIDISLDKLLKEKDGRFTTKKTPRVAIGKRGWLDNSPVA